MKNAIKCFDMNVVDGNDFRDCLRNNQVDSDENIEIFENCWDDILSDPKIGFLFGPNQLACYTGWYPISVSCVHFDESFPVSMSHSRFR